MVEKRNKSIAKNPMAWQKEEDRKAKSERLKKTSIFNNGTVYDFWVKKYGKEEADRRKIKMNEEQRKNAQRGENSHLFGKPPTSLSSCRGISGHYKGVHFRSLLELTFLIYLIDNNIPFISLEKKEFAIPYTYQDKKHNYFGDFLIENKNFVEIKHKRQQTDELVLVKKAAAEKFCLERGWTYKMINPTISRKLIIEKYKNGEIVFVGKNKDKFLKKYNL